MRSKIRVIGVSAALCGVLSGAPLAASATEFLVYDLERTGGGTLYDATNLTGATNPRSTVGGLVDIDFNAGGTLYGLASGDNPLLYTINSTTGTATPIGSGIGLNGIFQGDLAFDPTTGILYGLYQLATPNLNLFTINTTTGVATVVGGFSASFRNPAGMAFDSAGNLWVLNTQPGTSSLLQVNKTSGAVISDIGLIESGNPFNFSDGGAGMDFDPVTGTMYVATTLLWTLNTSSGVLTALLGGSSFLPNPTGLAVVPGATQLSEPGSLALLALVIAGLGCTRRRQ
jgi:hypothetical protein